MFSYKKGRFFLKKYKTIIKKMSRYIVFVINNEEYSIIADACVLKKFPDKIFNVFWNDEKYYVQSKVTMNILQTFIDNMIGKINGLPINPDNMNYYQQLFEEFEDKN